MGVTCMRTWRRFWVPRSVIRRRERRGRGARRSRLPLLAASLVGVCLALAVIAALDDAIRPMLNTMAESRVQNRVNEIVSAAVSQTLSQEAISYQDVISLEKDSSGAITALTSNMVRMNQLRAELLNAIIQQVDSLNSGSLGIPLGELTGIALLSRLGPTIPVQVRSVGAASAEFRNEFTSAGINQTYHRVMLDLSVELSVFVPGETFTTQVETQVCVAETVLVGAVPETYLQLTPGEM